MDFSYDKYEVIRALVEKKMLESYGYQQHVIIGCNPVMLTTNDFRDGTFPSYSQTVCYYGTVTVGHFDTGPHYNLFLNGEPTLTIDVQNKQVGTTYTDIIWNEYFVETGFPIMFVGYQFTLSTDIL